MPRKSNVIDKDESFHVRLTKDRHTSVKEVVDCLWDIKRMLIWDLIRRYNLGVESPDISDIIAGKKK